METKPEIKPDTQTIEQKIKEIEESIAKGQQPNPATIQVADLRQLIALAKQALDQKEADKKEQNKAAHNVKSNPVKKSQDEEKGTLEMGNRK